MKENKPVQPSPAVAVPNDFFAAIEVLRENLREPNRSVKAVGIRDNDKTRDAINVLLSTPTPPSAEPIPRGCELVGIYQLKRMSGIEHPDSAAISKSGPSTDSGVE